MKTGAGFDPTGALRNDNQPVRLLSPTYVLPTLSCFGLVWGFASRDPIVPLLLSLACAIAFVAWSERPERTVRRPMVIAWLTAIGGALLIAVPAAFFAPAGTDVYPVGDSAMLEMYTRHAASGIRMLGPYSQFGWHHPGPLFFYLLAPLYLLSGGKTVALHAGAFAINLLSLCAIGWVLIRCARPALAITVMAVLGLYLFRLEPVISSYWNPHVVMLPAAAFLVLSAALAAGRRGALPATALVGSFLVQTHISLAPYVLALGSGAVLAAVFWMPRPNGRSFGWWMAASIGLLGVLWLLPLIEQVSRTPGNITRLMRFFSEPSPGQDLSTAFVVWGDTMCALFRRELTIPEGLPLTIRAQSISMTGVGAVLQILLLAAVCRDAERRHDRFGAALSAAGIVASLTVLWSITRVKSLIGDYMVFWMSAIGALNWAVIAALPLTRMSDRLTAWPRRVAIGAAALLVAGFIHAGTDQLKHARRQGRIPPRGAARVVQVLSQAVLEDISRRQVRRPLFQMQTQAWGEAAGILLQVDKRGARPAVDPGFVALYGEPFAPDGQEDRVFVIADAARPETTPPAELIATVEGIAIYARPIAKRQ